jgi:hypothetical protein
MKKFVLIFREGVAITVEAESKLKAINILAGDYSRLFESQSFEIIEIFAEILANGEQVRY